MCKMLSLNTEDVRYISQMVPWEPWQATAEEAYFVNAPLTIGSMCADMTRRELSCFQLQACDSGLF